MSLNSSASLQFVAGLDRNALAESPPPIRSAPRAAPGSGRPCAAPEHPASTAKIEPPARTIREALQCQVQRGIGLFDRQLDEHGPAQRRDRGKGRQDLLALDVQASEGRVRHCRRARPDLRELRHVGVAQHEADIGMRDQAALLADHIGVAVLADLDLRHDVPDQFELTSAMLTPASLRVPASDSVM